MEARKNSGGEMSNGSITISPAASSIDYTVEKCSIDVGDLSPLSNSSNSTNATNKIHVFSTGNGDVHHHSHNNRSSHINHHTKSQYSSQDGGMADQEEEWTELNNAGDSSAIGIGLTQRKGVQVNKSGSGPNPSQDGDRDHSNSSSRRGSGIGKTTTTTTDYDNNDMTMTKEGEGEQEDLTEDFGLHVFNSKTCRRSHLLLPLTDMPAHLQFNKFVHTGYRRLHDFWGCFWSLFYLHNETVNIFTHVIPIIWVLCYWRTMYPWQEIEGNTFLNILGWSHVVASISPWLGSVAYHLFMNHERGARVYQKLLQIDMFGIWVTECFGALTNLSASTWCLPGNLQTIIIVLYAVGSVWGLQKAMTAWTPLGRRMCFAPVFITRILGFFLRISPYGGGEPSILLHVILQDAVSLVGGMIGVIRIPEIWFPGKLDFFCNSHHIMHVLVVLAVFHMNLATNGDIRWIIGNYSQCGAPAETPAVV